MICCSTRTEHGASAARRVANQSVNGDARVGSTARENCFANSGSANSGLHGESSFNVVGEADNHYCDAHEMKRGEHELNKSPVSFLRQSLTNDDGWCTPRAALDLRKKTVRCGGRSHGPRFGKSEPAKCRLQTRCVAIQRTLNTGRRDENVRARERELLRAFRVSLHERLGPPSPSPHSQPQLARVPCLLYQFSGCSRAPDSGLRSSGLCKIRRTALNTRRPPCVAKRGVFSR